MSDTTGWIRVDGEIRKVIDNTIYHIKKRGPQCWDVSAEREFVQACPSIYKAKRVAHRHAEGTKHG